MLHILDVVKVQIHFWDYSYNGIEHYQMVKEIHRQVIFFFLLFILV